VDCCGCRASCPPREINRIRGLLGTAVNVQSMVYGNLNDNSGTGTPPGAARTAPAPPARCCHS
jgi:hypothetical protein